MTDGQVTELIRSSLGLSGIASTVEICVDGLGAPWLRAFPVQPANGTLTFRPANWETWMRYLAAHLMQNRNSAVPAADAPRQPF